MASEFIGTLTAAAYLVIVDVHGGGDPGGGAILGGARPGGARTALLEDDVAVIAW